VHDGAGTVGEAHAVGSDRQEHERILARSEDAEREVYRVDDFSPTAQNRAFAFLADGISPVRGISETVPQWETGLRG
jgi:hypothetical protein